MLPDPVAAAFGLHHVRAHVSVGDGVGPANRIIAARARDQRFEMGLAGIGVGEALRIRLERRFLRGGEEQDETDQRKLSA